MLKQRLNCPVYYLLLLVIVMSYVAASLLPVSETFRGIASAPGTAALLGVFVQLMRDHWAYERAQELQRQRQDHAIAIASHMAAVTFDKQVAFCEAYVAELHEGLSDLFATGPTARALALADELRQIRTRFSAWISAEIEERLLPFERALRKIGAPARVLDAYPPGDARTKIVKEMFDTFGVLIGIHTPADDAQAQITAPQVVDYIREVLGIRELTRLRSTAVKKAAERVRPSGEEEGGAAK